MLTIKRRITLEEAYRLCHADEIVVAEDVFPPNHQGEGAPLLKEGATLTVNFLNRLQQRDVESVLIDYPLTALSKPSEQIREETLQLVNVEVNNFVRANYLHPALPAIEEDMYAALTESKTALVAVHLMTEYKPAFFRKSIRSALVSALLAHELIRKGKAVSAVSARQIALAALVQNVGYIYVADSCALEEERSLRGYSRPDFLAHPEKGSEILQLLGGDAAFCAIVHHHEEASDASGIGGLSLEEIPLESLFIRAGDDFRRLLDCGFSHHEALTKMADESMRYVVRAANGEEIALPDHLPDLIVRYPVGTVVVLNDGTHGRVSKVFEGDLERPMIDIIGKKEVPIFHEDSATLKGITYVTHLDLRRSATSTIVKELKGCT
ncbi:MAG: hypothetical protein HYV63_18960 [Candidatus Schekmanbacteria bacterium]|nr:hypothetical protein [Candidatus Schekmanbacteria bacterium]